jgi:hypothetical protein
MFFRLTLTYTFEKNHVTVQTKTMNLLENIDNADFKTFGQNNKGLRLWT